MSIISPRNLLSTDSHFPIRWLKLFGYLPEVDIENLESAALDPQKAVQRFQRLYGTEVAGADDGWLWARSLSAMTLKRCSNPDEEDEQLAKLGDDDPEKLFHFLLDDDLVGEKPKKKSKRGSQGRDPQEHQETDRLTAGEVGQVYGHIHKSMIVAASGDSNWGRCRENIRVHCDTSRAPSWWDKDDIFGWSQKRYAEVGARLVETDSVDPRENEIRVSFRNGRSWIGLAEFGGCDSSVFCYFDPGYNGGLLRNRVLNLHEHGHNCTCRHTRGGIMNPVILSTKPYWVIRDEGGRITYRDTSYSYLAQVFGGDPLDAPDTPSPPPTESITLPLKGVWNDENFGGVGRTSDGRVVIVRIKDGEIVGEYA